MGLGCGHPLALASLKAGDLVLDLGSGAGLDAFLAAQKGGETGRVIGVDMTPERLAKAAGFAEVKIVGQTHFPVEAMANDVPAAVVRNNPLVSEKDLRGLANSVFSIKVHAVKPRKGKTR